MPDFTKISLNKWKGDGQIYCKDVGELMRALGHNPKEADVARLLPENVEKDGRIPFETFLPMLQDISQKLIKAGFFAALLFTFYSKALISLSIAHA